MLGCSTRLSLHMHAPLERNLIVGTHPCKAWQGRVHSLEISEVQRVRQTTQHVTEFGTVPRLARLHACSCTTLNLRQYEVVWDVHDRLHSHCVQFLHCAGMEAWQEPDVILRERRIAVIEKFASNRVGTVRANSDVGR